MTFLENTCGRGTNVKYGSKDMHLDHCKFSVSETKRTELTCIESYDDADIHLPQDRRESKEIPDWIEHATIEDDDSLSSLSSCEGRTTQRRCIFSSHWERPSAPLPCNKNAPFPKRKLCAHPAPYAADSDDDFESSGDVSGNTYERTLLANEGSQGLSAKSCSDRRSIFAGCSNRYEQSLPRVKSAGFSMNPQLSSNLRRYAFSDSALVVKKLPSCLRPSRYSGETFVRERSERSQPVSFSASVTMIKYEIPQEQWAASGWSKFFS